MRPADQLVAAFSRLRRGAAGPELLPLSLAEACARSLPVAGAGLSLTQDLRVPLAASDELVATAERLQTTLGEGPCLSATAERGPLVADLEEIAGRWPMFHQAILAQTPFRAVASIPLSSPAGERFGALDLYSKRSDATELDRIAVDGAVIAERMVAALFPARDAKTVTADQWLASAPVNSRMLVWVAVGMLLAAARIPNADALSLLRSYAYLHGTTIDEVAHLMSTGQLAPEAVMGAID